MDKETARRLFIEGFGQFINGDQVEKANVIYTTRLSIITYMDYVMASLVNLINVILEKYNATYEQIAEYLENMFNRKFYEKTLATLNKSELSKLWINLMIRSLEIKNDILYRLNINSVEKTIEENTQIANILYNYLEMNF